MIVFEKLSQVLAAAYKWDIGIAGTYLRLSACQWPCTVLLYKQGRVIGQMANMLAGDYVNGVDFDAVSVLNGATAQQIDVQVSGGGAGSNRVLGEVSVIDGGKVRSLASQAFSWANGSPAVVGQLGRSQLMNPVGSGKNIVVKAFSVSPASACTVSTHVLNAALATNGAAIQNAKYPVGNAPVAQSRYDSVVSATPSMRYVDVVQFAAAGISRIQLQEPVVLPPGWGITCECGSVNITINSTFEWVEENQQ